VAIFCALSLHPKIPFLAAGLWDSDLLTDEVTDADCEQRGLEEAA